MDPGGIFRGKGWTTARVINCFAFPDFQRDVDWDWSARARFIGINDYVCRHCIGEDLHAEERICKPGVAP